MNRAEASQAVHDALTDALTPLFMSDFDLYMRAVRAVSAYRVACEFEAIEQSVESEMRAAANRESEHV